MSSKKKLTALTRKEIADDISRDSNFLSKEVFYLVSQVIDTITEALAQGRTVEFRNFGTFEVRVSKPRIGRNPHKPSKDVAIPSRAIVKFRPGKILKQRVRLLTNELTKKSAKK